MHVSAIFKKLDVKNRTEAVAKYSDMQRVSELIS
jgi:DNA-binding NarL/FixJ family response regulator